MTSVMNILGEVFDKSNRPERLFSPHSSEHTGDTGSSESEGDATRSLLMSVDEREFFAPQTSSTSDQSWSKILAVDNGTTLSQGTAENESQAPTSPSTNAQSHLVQVTASQEVAGLEETLSGVDRWRVDTNDNARGDGTSTIGSDEIEAALALIRREKTGLGYSDNKRDTAIAPPDEYIYGGARVSVRSQAYSSDLFDENTSEHFEVDFYRLDELVPSRTKVNGVVTTEESVQVSECQNVVDSRPSLENLASDSRGHLGWKISTICLGIALVANVVLTYRSSIIVEPFSQLSTFFNTKTTLEPYLHISPTLLDVPSLTSVVAPTLIATTVLDTADATLQPIDFAVTVIEPALQNSGNLLFVLVLAAFLAACLDYYLHESSPATEAKPVSICPVPKLVQEDPVGESISDQVSESSNGETVKESPEESGRREDWGPSAEEGGPSSEVATPLDKSTFKEPSNLESIAEGQTSFILSHYDTARRHLELAIAKDDQSALAFEYLGKTLIRLGEVAAGESHLRRAIELDPTLYSSLAFLGEHLQLCGRAFEAEELLNAATRLRDDYPAVHMRLAILAVEDLITLDTEEVYLITKQYLLACRHLNSAWLFQRDGYPDPCLESVSEVLDGPRYHVLMWIAHERVSDESGGKKETLGFARSRCGRQILFQLLEAADQYRKAGWWKGWTCGDVSSFLQVEEEIRKMTTLNPSDLECQALSILVACLKQRYDVFEVYKRIGDFVRSKGGSRGWEVTGLATYYFDTVRKAQHRRNLRMRYYYPNLMAPEG